MKWEINEDHQKRWDGQVSRHMIMKNSAGLRSGLSAILTLNINVSIVEKVPLLSINNIFLLSFK